MSITANTSQLQFGQTSLGHPLEFQSGTPMQCQIKCQRFCSLKCLLINSGKDELLTALSALKTALTVL
jgi:hypothetical protein